MRLVYFILLFSMPLHLAASGFKGKVFRDNNENGIYDKGDLPLVGIMVTDGLNVVKTSVDGTFILPGYTKARFITLTTPAGYKTHKQYIKIDDGVKEYNFPLTINNITGKPVFSFISITDTESMTGGEWVDNIRDYAKNENVAFIVHTGDICYEAGLRFHRDSINSSTMGTTIYYAIGNHDLLDGAYGEAFYEECFGPCWYSFDAGKVHFVVTPMPYGDYTPSYTMDEVLAWLENDLSQLPKDQPVVIFNHDLLLNDHNLVLKTKDRILDLGDYNIRAWIYGHWHINYLKPHPSGLLAVCSSTPDKGGIDHSPSSFRVITFDEHANFSIDTRYTYVDKKLTVVYPNSFENIYSNNGSIPVSVNAYNTTSAIDEVRYRIKNLQDNGKWYSMIPSGNWSWQALYPLPKNTSAQEMEIEVVARLRTGEELKTSSAFNYIGKIASLVAITGSWTDLRGNAAHNTITDNDSGAALSHLWITNVGANIFMTSPIVADNMVFIASIDDNLFNNSHIHALNGITGREIWRYSTRNAVKNTIVFNQGKILAIDVKGYIYAIDAKSGKLVWEKKLPVNQLPAIVDGIVTEGDIVYAGSGNGLCALHISDGTEIWRNKEWDQGEGTTSTMTLGNGVLLTGAHWRGLYAHDAKSGELLWKANDHAIRFRDGSATYLEGKFYIASSEHLFVFGARTGIVEHMKLAELSFNSASSPLLFGNKWVTGTSNKGLAAFDIKCLELTWHFLTKASVFYTVPYSKNKESSVEVSPVLNGSYIYFGASDGIFYAVEAATGKKAWQIDFGTPVFSSAAIVDKMIFVADFSGNVHGFLINDTMR